MLPGLLFAMTRTQMYKQRQGGPEVRLAALPDASGDQLFSLAFATVSDRNAPGVRASAVTSLSHHACRASVPRGTTDCRPGTGGQEDQRTKQNNTRQWC